MDSPIVGVVMGSRSDYDTLLPGLDLLREFSIPHEARIVSAHRTPDWLFQYAEQAESRGLRIIIAGAGGAAHLPGMIAAKTILPVLAVPIPSTCLQGIDSLLSIVQMPKGIPVPGGYAGHRQARRRQCSTAGSGDSSRSGPRTG
jgi:5-(carboxyamino)imidazole ribonucleotide mutase